MLSQLLWRHLWGKHSRPAVRWMNRFAVLSLIISLASLLTVRSVMKGMQSNIREHTLKTKPHLLLETKPTLYPEEEKKILREILADQAQVNFLLNLEALVERPAAESEQAQAAGIVLKGIPFDNSESVKISSALAEKLNVAYGDKVLVRSPWRMQSLPLSLQITELSYEGYSEWERYYIYIGQDRIRKWLGFEGNKYNRVEIYLNDPYQADAVRLQIQNKLQYEFKTWQETEAALFYSLELEMFLMLMTLGFIVLLSLVSLYLALAVRINEKVREVALLRALGCRNSKVLWLYFVEGMVIALLGCIGGYFVAYGICHIVIGYLVKQNIIPWLSELVDLSSIRYQWDFTESFIIFVGAIIACLLVTYFSSRQLTRVNIVDALKS